MINSKNFLRFLVIGFAVGVITGCATKQSTKSMASKTVIHSPMAPVTVVEETQKFLEWQKGYNIKVRDIARGLLVTDWMEDSPISRHQFMIRVNRDLEGALLTAHVVVEQFSGTQWQSVVAAPQWENRMVHELKTYLDAKSTAAKKN